MLKRTLLLLTVLWLPQWAQGETPAAKKFERSAKGWQRRLDLTDAQVDQVVQRDIRLNGALQGQLDEANIWLHRSHSLVVLWDQTGMLAINAAWSRLKMLGEAPVGAVPYFFFKTQSLQSKDEDLKQYYFIAAPTVANADQYLVRVEHIFSRGNMRSTASAQALSQGNRFQLTREEFEKMQKNRVETREKSLTRIALMKLKTLNECPGDLKFIEFFQDGILADPLGHGAMIQLPSTDSRPEAETIFIKARHDLKTAFKNPDQKSIEVMAFATTFKEEARMTENELDKLFNQGVTRESTQLRIERAGNLPD